MQPPAQAHHHQSYYAVLGVQPGATAAEIRAAYHRLAMVSTSYQLLRSVTHNRFGIMHWLRRMSENRA
jgi:hypothetical protein